MALTAREEAAILHRLKRTRPAREKFLRMVLEARLRSVAGDHDGLVRLISDLGILPETAAILVRGEKSAKEPLDAHQKCQRKALLETSDFAEIAFLEKGWKAAKAVGRLVGPGGVGDGSCFMISESLLLTAYHAIRDEATAKDRFVQFDFEVDPGGNRKAPTQCSLDPGRFFEKDSRPELDFTIVALEEPISAEVTGPVGFCALPSKQSPHALETFVNIIQHPGKTATKQVVYRENRLVCIPDAFLYYTADTNGGSSGAPVFNDEWQVVGMHRYAVPRAKLGLPKGYPYFDNVNMGVRATAIVAELKARLPKLTGKKRELLEKTIST